MAVTRKRLFSGGLDRVPAAQPQERGPQARKVPHFTLTLSNREGKVIRTATWPLDREGRPDFTSAGFKSEGEDINEVLHAEMWAAAVFMAQRAAAKNSVSIWAIAFSWEGQGYTITRSKGGAS